MKTIDEILEEEIKLGRKELEEYKKITFYEDDIIGEINYNELKYDEDKNSNNN